MCWFQVGSANAVGVTSAQFLAAITVWCNKPHVANRRLCGSELMWTETLLSLRHNCAGADIASKLVALFSVADNDCPSAGLESISGRLHDKLLKWAECEQEKTLAADDGGSCTCAGVQIMLRCLIQKLKGRNKVLEVIVIDHNKPTALFMPVCDVTSDNAGLIVPTTELTYSVNFSESTQLISMHVLDKKDDCGSDGNKCCKVNSANVVVDGQSTGVHWLAGILLSKLARWSQETQLNTEVLSLRLTGVQQYSIMYDQLKQKYGSYFVEMWTEQTDPQKFVYEDIGIAAYLLVLWQKERELKGLTKKQTFIDLGCGNGLLVYILTSEGHSGVGVDIRQRKIWDVLGQVADLKVQTIVPSNSTTFSDFDWLIGNHSDELTPWIPVMAARSCYSCRFFVLPCCAWDFTSKFADKASGVSQYRVYLDYIRAIGEKSGFVVCEDVLRIPSTKRVCFIGMDRSYAAEDEEQVELKRQQFISRRCQSISDCQKAAKEEMKDEQSTEQGTAQIVGFQPRPVVERLRNAVAIERSIKDFLIDAIFREVLSRAMTPIITNCGKSWNRGGTVSLNEIGSLFNKDVLSKLKHECGGLQTLIKNCPDVFVVQNGCVSLRDWTSPEYIAYRESRQKRRPNSSAKQRLKTTLCFFNQHHPDGCLLPTTQCRFAHGKHELRNNVVCTEVEKSRQT